MFYNLIFGLDKRRDFLVFTKRQLLGIKEQTNSLYRFNKYFSAFGS